MIAIGYATKEDNIAYLDESTAKDVKDKSVVENYYSSPNDGRFVSSPHGYPAYNFLQVFYPMPEDGTQLNTYTNAPGGNYSTLGIGTKVLVVYPDFKGIGYIIRQIPYDDEMSKIIKNLADE